MIWLSLIHGIQGIPFADSGGPFWLLPNFDVNPDILFTIGGFPVASTLLSAMLSVVINLLIFIPATRKMAIVPRGLQNFVEWATGLLLDFCEEVAGKQWGRKFFPLIATIFFYVLIGNWMSLIPGVNAIGTPKPGVHSTSIFFFGADSNKITPWLRPPSTDINFTLSLALISVVITQIYGFRVLGVRSHIGKYITLREFPLGLIVGIFEAITELARIISFSFRLFGNIFAGDVLLVVMGTLLPVLGATVFYPLELFIGFIQAFVFAALTLIFLSLAISGHEGEEHAAQTAHS